jgi:hypothetical protein
VRKEEENDTDLQTNVNASTANFSRKYYELA